MLTSGHQIPMAGLSTYNSDNSSVVVRLIAGIGLSDKCQRGEEKSDPAEQAQAQGQGAP